MSFDGITEEENISAKLAGLAGDRIFDETPDDNTIPIDSSGKVRPYIVLSIGAPYADPNGDRSYADGEQDIPYILTVVVGCYAGDRDALNALYKVVAKRLIGWSPNEDNATELGTARTRPSSKPASASRPATLGKLLMLRCVINLQGE